MAVGFPQRFWDRLCSSATHSHGILKDFVIWPLPAPQSVEAEALTFAHSRRETKNRCAPCRAGVCSNTQQNSNMAGNCPRKISEYRIVVSLHRSIVRDWGCPGELADSVT